MLKLYWYDIAHFLIGLMVGMLNGVSSVLAAQGVLLFCMYEFIEELRIWDKSYRDILVFGLGWGAGTVWCYWKDIVNHIGYIGYTYFIATVLILTAATIILRWYNGCSRTAEQDDNS